MSRSGNCQPSNVVSVAVERGLYFRTMRSVW